jgi:hypothetical protein
LAIAAKVNAALGQTTWTRRVPTAIAIVSTFIVISSAISSAIGSTSLWLAINSCTVSAISSPLLRSLVLFSGRSVLRFGTDYVDITGEVPWVKRLIERSHS